MAYSWGLFEVGLPLSPPEPHGSSDSLERTAAGVRIAGGKMEQYCLGIAYFRLKCMNIKQTQLEI